MVPVGIQVCIGKDYYSLSCNALWNAVCRAVGKEKLVIDPPKGKKGKKDG